VAVVRRLLDELPGFHRESGRSEGYKVFTPFYRKWTNYLQEHPRFPYATRIVELPQAEGDEEGNGELFPLPEEVREAVAWDGEPLVPELNETGAMPNRLRMVTAKFLTKNLLCPFPFGERYFRRKLADYDNTLNRGGLLGAFSANS
jgi:deoxyribodipyrimidine photolyase